jgi:hypothetical protein
MAESPVATGRAKYGAVAVLDALGVKGKDIKQSLHFLDTFTGLFDELESETRSQVIDASNLTLRPEVRTFQDTIVLTWDLADKDGIFHCLTFLGWRLGGILTQALAQGIPLRGAVSIGNFVQTPMAVLGPAVADAFNWHNKSDWVGVVLTPNAGQVFCDEISSTTTGIAHSLTQFFEFFDVPIKSCRWWPFPRTRRMWAVAWPVEIARQYELAEEFETVRYPLSFWFEHYCRLWKLKVSKAKSKYRNSGNFIAQISRSKAWEIGAARAQVKFRRTAAPSRTPGVSP